MNQILINSRNEEEVRVALLQNKELIGLNIEGSLVKRNKGNVYKGKITRVEPSLNAFFVDYGVDKQGFLPFKEIAGSYRISNKSDQHLADDAEPSQSEPIEADAEDSSPDDAAEHEVAATSKERKTLKYSEIALKEGQEIIVQVDKEERGNKGASLTTFILLAGAYSILMPNSPKGACISRRINAKDRKNLKDELKKISLPKDSGLIIRTSGSTKDAKELQWEVDYLLKLWAVIEDVAKKYPAPFLIYQENDIIVRTLRDYLRENIESVYIDDKESFRKAEDFATYVLPQYQDRLKFFPEENKSLFEHIGIERQVSSIFEREVPLKSGGTIVFDTTEALTAIDVNSARYNKGEDIEQTALHTNLEATREIAKQCQLRDLGGLVVIDFIDMLDGEHQNQVEKAMTKAVESDKARIQLSKLSRFGLMEMSRQRLRLSLVESTKKVCKQCNGSGFVITIPSLALDMLRQIEKSFNNNQELAQLTVQSTAEVISYLINEKRQSVIALENKFGVRIALLPNPYMLFPNFSIQKQKNEKKSTQPSFHKIYKPQYTLNNSGIFEVKAKPMVQSHRPHKKNTAKKKRVMGAFYCLV